MAVRLLMAAATAFVVATATVPAGVSQAAEMGAQTTPYPHARMGPGGMGPGGMRGWNMQRGGAMQGSMMGYGTMGPGSMGPGMMGYGMMGPGMMGPGMMGRGMIEGQRVFPTRDLNAADVRRFLEDRLAWRGNDRIKVGPVKEKDKDTIVADIVTVKEGALVDRFDVDRHTGLVTRVN